MNICIIGCGEIASTHARNLHRRTRLWFYSRTRRSAERMNQVFNGMGVFPSYPEVLANRDIQGLIICTPPEYHAEQAISGLNCGKSILVEKPLCTSISELKAIKEASSQNMDNFVMVAENYLYKPSLMKILELIHAGEIGNLKHICVNIGYQEQKGGWRDRYGALFECGIHFISQISAMMGDTHPKEIDADFPGWKLGEPERTSVVYLRYQDGKTGKLSFSWNKRSLPKGAFQISWLEGDNGRIIFESNGLFVLSVAGTKRRLTFPGFDDLTGRKAMVRDFMRCISDVDATPRADLKNAEENLEIVIKAYGSKNVPVRV